MAVSQSDDPLGATEDPVVGHVLGDKGEATETLDAAGEKEGNEGEERTGVMFAVL